jgi:hypothetical protein
MGCASSTPVVPDLPAMPSNIVQLLPGSASDLKESCVELLTTSFCGTSAAAPEGLLNWALDPSCSVDEDPSKPLKEEPSAERKKHFRWLVNFSFDLALPHGGCFAVMKDGR